MKVIKKYISNSPLRNFNYILYCDKSHEALFIDPLDLDQTLPLVNDLKLKPKYLLNTHYHPDHIKDNEKLMQMYPDVSEIKLRDSERFNLSDEDYLEAIYTPGHLDPHFCFKLFKDSKSFGLITGDILFNGGIGNARQGDVQELYTTITEKIMPLEDHLKVYPAHDYIYTNLKFSLTVEKDNLFRDSLLKKIEKMIKTREYIDCDHCLGDEKKYNPFLRLSELKEKDFEGKSEKEIFLKLRALRDKW